MSALQLDHSFDASRNRHYLNGFLSVIHCHHYTALYTQLALDAGQTRLLQETAEDSFYDVLRSYFQQHGITDLKSRLELSCEYYAAMGLGHMRVKCFGWHSAEVELLSSHVDEGWLLKWGQYTAPVNYITAGYVAALCEAVQELPLRSFRIQETASIVMGAEKSLFRAARN